jgi:hypothetical protein
MNGTWIRQKHAFGADTKHEVDYSWGELQDAFRPHTSDGDWYIMIWTVLNVADQDENCLPLNLCKIVVMSVDGRLQEILLSNEPW